MQSYLILQNLGNRQDRYTENECYQLWEVLEYQTEELKQADISTLTALVEIFAKAYWDSDTCLSDVLIKSLLKKLPQKRQTEMIEILLKHTMLYPWYVAMANDLMTNFPVEVKKSLKIYPVKLAKNESVGTEISFAEYSYRCRLNLKCFKLGDEFYRPMQYQDLECFYDSMNMAYQTGNPTYIFLG